MLKCRLGDDMPAGLKLGSVEMKKHVEMLRASTKRHCLERVTSMKVLPINLMHMYRIVYRAAAVAKQAEDMRS